MRHVLIILLSLSLATLSGQENPIDSLHLTPAMTCSAFVSGVITGVAGKEFATVSIRGLDGIASRFYWLQRFPGDELLTNLKKRGRFPVEIEYETQEIYAPARQEYVPRRVIVAIRVLE